MKRRRRKEIYVRGGRGRRTKEMDEERPREGEIKQGISARRRRRERGKMEKKAREGYRKTQWRRSRKEKEERRGRAKVGKKEEDKEEFPVPYRYTVLICQG